MTVYDYLSLINQVDDMNISIFDCNTEDAVFTSKRDEREYDALFSVSDSGYDIYEVESVDIFTDKDGIICIELNIDIEE